MVVIRGINLYPSAVDGLVRAFPEVSEYQVIVSQSRGMKEVRMRAECDPMVATAVEAAMHTEFSLRVPVEPLPKDSLPRSEMKARRWVHQDAELK
jgi:phenylacetate-CoA ligase